MFTAALEKSLATFSHHHELKEIMHYAVLPAGKLFRPRLVEALSIDLAGTCTPNDIHLGSAIELHHAYTLVHDDLPAMDNDLIRRGKPSTHAKFGEWKAILAGDALLIASFQELMKVDHPRIKELHRLFSWCTGARGLISGQFLDLQADGKMDFPLILRIHELKTARLIQVATLGTFLLHGKNQNLKSKKEFLRLGREIGVTFQLLDDLSELTDPEVSPHETLINPFLIAPEAALSALKNSHQRLLQIIEGHQLQKLTEMLQDYFRNSQKHLIDGKDNLLKHTDSSLHTELNDWITNFS